MPILFLSDAYAEATNDLSVLLHISFKAVTVQNIPIANSLVSASMIFGNVTIADQSSMTDSNGEGWVDVYTYPSIGNSAILNIKVGNQFGEIPVVLYNPNQSPALYIDKASYYNGKFYIEQTELNQDGLLLQARFTDLVKPDGNARVYIKGFFISRIPQFDTVSLNFKIPPATLGVHVATPGEYEIFYSRTTVSGNTYIPYYTTLVVVGDEVTTRLLSLVLLTQVPGYINIVDNLLGVDGIIPGGQPNIEVGDQWHVFYSLIDPSSDDTIFIPVENGIVNSSGEIEFPIPAGFFPEGNNVPVWFWYSITKSSGRQYTSTIARFTLDTN